jgi:hypothetical protein
MSVEEKLRQAFLALAETVSAKESVWDEISREVQRRELPERPSAADLLGASSSERGQVGHSRSRASRSWSVLVAAAAAVLIGVVVAISQVVVSPGHADARGVHIVRSGGYIDATIDDPTAPTASMQAAFDEANLNITVSVLPSSPSIAGTIEFMDVPASFEPIYGGSCISDGALTDTGELIRTPCVIGMRVPADFSGYASIQVSGTPPAGQPYETSADAFAPGEVLHCSGIGGMTVAEALPILQTLGVTPIWQVYGGDEAGASVSEASVESFFIRDAFPHSLGTVNVIVQPYPASPSDRTTLYYDALTADCPPASSSPLQSPSAGR